MILDLEQKRRKNRDENTNMQASEMSWTQRKDIVLTTSSVNVLVYSADSAREAAAAGHILLSMVAVSYPSVELGCSDTKIK